MGHSRSRKVQRHGQLVLPQSIRCCVGVRFGEQQLVSEFSGGDAAAKDLGILNIATNIPQALSPVVAALVILVLGGYSMLFVFGMVFVVIAAFAVAPIKAVR